VYDIALDFELNVLNYVPPNLFAGNVSDGKDRVCMSLGTSSAACMFIIES
jgi:hypothetical protein